MVLYLSRLCQCGLKIGILVSLLAAEPLSPAGILFLSQCLSVTILLTQSVFDGVGLAGFKSRATAFVLA